MLAVGSHEPVKAKATVPPQQAQTGANNWNENQFNPCWYRLATRVAPAAAGEVVTRPAQVQTKLAIGDASDPAEREADMMAERVLRRPRDQTQAATTLLQNNRRPAIQRSHCCNDCEDELRRATTRPEESAAAESAFESPAQISSGTEQQIHNLKDRGQPLPQSLRASFESSFGYDFSRVRVHTDTSSAESARALNARAYTFGREIVFAAGQYAPETKTGQHLLAHELTHVAQQQSASSLPRRASAVSSPDDAAEIEADRVASRVLSGAKIDAIGMAPANRLHRQPNHEGEQGGELPMSRGDEVALSRSSPGAVTGSLSPLMMSLYAFAIDDAHLKPRHNDALAIVARLLAAAPAGFVSLVSTGHADASGRPILNTRLSRRRAQEATASLERHASGSIETRWHGEDDPAASNDTVEGRTRNRRVDIFFAFPRREPDDRRRDDVVEQDRTQEDRPPERRREPTERPRETTPRDDRGVCQRHPILCFLGGLLALAALGIAAFTVFSILAEAVAGLALGGLAVGTITAILGVLGGITILGGVALGIAGLIDWLRRLLPGTTPPVPPEETPEEPEEDGRPAVRFGPIQPASSQPGMNPRIPPRRDTPVQVFIRGWQPGTPPVTIRLVDANARNGTLTINGRSQVELTADATLNLQGVTQTVPGAAERLALGAQQNTPQRIIPLALSDRFSVSAIPENVTVIFDRRYDADTDWIGFIVDTTWLSDSGDPNDLNEVHLWEVVSTRGTGCFAGVTAITQNEGDILTGVDALEDQHAARISALTSPGTATSHQIMRFNDRRSNSRVVPMRGSGFDIDHVVTPDPTRPGCFQIATTERGAVQSASGIMFGTVLISAGRTVPSPITDTQPVPCTPTPGPTPPPTGGTPGAPPTTGAPPAAGAPPGGVTTTPVRPRPYSGPALTNQVNLTYMGGLPRSPVEHQVYTVTLGFITRSGGHTADVRYEVTSITNEWVFLQSTNTSSLNLAPEGEQAVVIAPSAQGSVSRRLLRLVPQRSMQRAAPTPTPTPMPTPTHHDAGLPGGTAPHIGG